MNLVALLESVHSDKNVAGKAQLPWNSAPQGIPRRRMTGRAGGSKVRSYITRKHGHHYY